MSGTIQRNLITILIVVFALPGCKEKQKKVIEEPKKISSFFYDYEDAFQKGHGNKVQEGNAISGKYSNILNGKNAKGIGQITEISEIECKELSKIYFKAWICPMGNSITSSFVFSILDHKKDHKKALFWKAFHIEKKQCEPEVWFPVEGEIIVKTDSIAEEDLIQFYFWNRDSSSFLVDDLEVYLCDNYSSNKSDKFFDDLEKGKSYKKSKTINTEVAYSGEYSSKVSGKNSYSISIINEVENINNYKNIDKIGLSAWIYSLDSEIDAVLVFTIIDTITGETDYWQGKVIQSEDFKTKKWVKVSSEFIYPRDKIKESQQFQMYLWNRKGNTLYVDDFYVSFKKTDKEVEDVYIDLTKGTYEEQKKINYPPFPQKFLYKHDISEYENIAGLLDFSLFENNIRILSGSFNGKDINSEQALVIHENKSFLLDFKNTNKVELEFDNIPDNLYFISCNIDNTPVDEIIGYNKYDESLFIGKVNLKEKQVDFTNHKLGFKPLIIENINKGILILSSDLELYRCFFDNQLETVKINSQYELKSATEYKLIAGNFEKQKNEQILIISGDSVRYDCSLLTIDYSTNKITDWKNPINIGVDTLKTSSNYYVVDADNDGIDQLIKYDDAWRFDLKLMHYTDNYFTTTNTLDFKGYSNYLNPKFYEKLNIVGGRFINSEYSFIVVGSNSLEQEKEMQHLYFDKNNDFKPSIQIYSLNSK